MDVSFEPTMAGGGWGADVGNISMTQPPGQSSGTNFEKIPLPVTLKDAANCVTEDDKFHIGNYSFVNVRTCGRVESIEDSPSGERYVYLNDPTNVDDIKFKVIIYDAVQSKCEPYAEGDIVFVLGKIRVFDNEISMLVFNLQVVDTIKKVENLLTDAELAKFYYNNNIPDKVSNGVAVELNDTYFNNQPVIRRNAAPGSQPHTTSTGFNGPPTTPNSRGLTGVKAKIHTIIQNSNDEAGINIDDIRREVGNVPKFDDELQYLVNEGMIYTTIDENHYSAL